MHCMSIITTTALAFAASAFADPSWPAHAKYHEKRAELVKHLYASQTPQVAELEPREASTQYLTSKTKKFAVDGKHIPGIPVDLGESYAGLLPVDNTGKELYFWFVPTTNPAAKDEITIWLNGGPGCSSLDGFFKENGPVVWQTGTYAPVRNTYAWSNLTNVVWVEQPVGTGFSKGVANATSEIDVATQFRGFWKNFIDTFDLQNRKVYITGESYAGQYVPYIADGFLNQTGSDHKKYFDVNGIIVYDPSIGYDSITEQVPTLAFTRWNHNDFPFNDTFKAEIANMSARCGYDAFLEEGLTFPPKGPFKSQPGTDLKTGNPLPGCDIFDTVLEAIFEINPCFDIYQVGQGCPLLWDVLGFPYSDFYLPEGFTQPYFNRTDVKKAIHAPLNVNWEICADGVFKGKKGDQSPPSGINGGPLARVVERTNNVIVGHGALDMVLILNGTLLTLNNLTWNGAQGFTKKPTKPFYVPYHFDPTQSSVAGAGVLGSWQEDRGLTFVSVAFSGHMIPQNQPSAAYRHLEKLLGRIKSLSQVSAFSTQPGYPQPRGALGRGTAPPAV